MPLLRRLALIGLGLTFALPGAHAQRLELAAKSRRPPSLPPTRPVPQPQDIRMKYLGVKTTITDQVATTEIDQTFHNPNNWQAEGTYLFPLPEGTTISNFKMYMGGKAVSGEVLDADTARTIYRTIVRQRRDPGLLEFVGHRLVRASVFPIPAKGDVRITLAFTRVLEADEGWFDFNYPLSSAGKDIAEVNFDVTLKSKTPIKNIYSPTHKVHVERTSDRHVRVRYEKTNLRPERSLSLLYSTSAADLGLNALMHREAGKTGYFMVAIAPKVELKKEEIVPKSIVFVLDTSGSMAGPKMKQAREALSHCINRLEDNAHFNVVRFSTEVEALTEEGLLSANDKNKKKALGFVDEFEAAGGTNIDEALALALELAGKRDGLTEIVFITDGKPTIGERDGASILKNVGKANKSRARLFVFGVGDNLNTHLLDKLADEHRGARQYVAEGESIERKVSAFYNKIAAPVMTDLKLDFGGLDIKHVYPRDLPDLFAGTQLLVLGRYRGEGGARAITLSGKVAGKAKKYVYETTFAPAAEDNDFLPRLWAQRKVGFLLDQIRLHGANAELRAEVVALAKQYGIVTPFTSALVLEDTAEAQALRTRAERRAGNKGPGDGALAGGGKGGRRPARTTGTPDAEAPRPKKGEKKNDAQADPKADGKAEAGGRAPAAPKSGFSADDLKDESGKKAVELSRKLKKMRQSESLEEADEDLREGGKRGKAAVKKVGSKTFIRRADGFWVDSVLVDGSKKTKDKLAKATKVEYLGDAYFDLVAKHKAMGRYLKVGDKVLVEHGGAVYRIE